MTKCPPSCRRKIDFVKENLNFKWNFVKHVLICNSQLVIIDVDNGMGSNRQQIITGTDKAKFAVHIFIYVPLVIEELTKPSLSTNNVSFFLFSVAQNIVWPSVTFLVGGMKIVATQKMQELFVVWKLSCLLITNDTDEYALLSTVNYCKISWSLRAVRFGFRFLQSLWNVTGISAAVLKALWLQLQKLNSTQYHDCK